MGATIDERKVLVSSTEELKKIFDNIVSDCQWESGHGGYTGTFAEKDGVEIIPGTWGERDAYEHAVKNNPKWGPAFAYKIGKHETGKDIYLIVGWCSE